MSIVAENIAPSVVLRRASASWCVTAAPHGDRHPSRGGRSKGHDGETTHSA